jgi:hypothetical protein
MELSRARRSRASLEGPLEIAEALACAIQIADALDARIARIVHRDLKPAT